MNARTQKAKQIMDSTDYVSQIDHDKSKVKSQTNREDAKNKPRIINSIFTWEE